MSFSHVIQLNNGLRVCLLPDEHLESVAIQIRGLAGSNYESNSQIGVAHFLEHAILADTNVTQALNKVTFNGGKYFAVTSRDDVLYGINALKDDLDLAIEVFSSILAWHPENLSNIETIKSVIRAEITRKYDIPEKVLAHFAMQNLFNGTRLAKLNIGDENTLKILDHSKVSDFYAKHYHPHNFVLAIAGNFDVTTIQHLLEKNFAKSVLKVIPLKKLSFSAKSQFGVNTNINAALKQTYIRHDYMGLDFNHDTKHSAMILAKLLSSYIKKQSQRRGLAYKTNVDSLSEKNYGVVSFFAVTPKEYVHSMQNLISNSITNVHKLLDTENIQRAKNAIIADITFLLEKPSYKCSYYTEVLLKSDKPYTHQEEIEKIKAIENKDIHSIANNLFKQQPVTSII